MKRAFTYVAFLLALVGSGSAQEILSTITGTVTDQSGAVIPGVNVTVRNLDTAKEATVATASDGSYRVTQLLAGNYEVSGTTKGFKKVLRPGIHLNVGDHVVVDLRMTVGLVTEQVQVNDLPPTIETASSELSGV